MKVAIVPAYNEEGEIDHVLRRLRNYVDKIIVVDDGSRDKTGMIAKKYAIVIKHPVNLGKGAALRTGCKEALKFKPRYLFFVDADGQHDPDDIVKFLEKLEKGYDLVQGVRDYDKMPLLKKIGNLILTFAFKILFGFNTKDTQCGYKGLRSEILPRILWNSNDYFVESEILARVAVNNLRYCEVPIKTIYKKGGYKGATIFDGLKIFIRLIVLKIILNTSKKKSKRSMLKATK